MQHLTALKDRLDPYLSVKVFGLTLGGLLLLGSAGAAITIATAEKPAFDLSVTVPLSGGEKPAEAAPGPVSVNTLAPDDMEQPGEVPVQQDHAQTKDPVAPPKPKATIEDAIAGLHKNTPNGMIPVVRKEDGLTAFKAYSAEFTPDAGTKALVSLVMVDFGLSKTASDQAIAELPDGVTFALSPYARDAQKWTTSARQDGHEVWLGLPVQNKDFGDSDSGNLTLLVNASVDQNKSRLLKNLGKATGYVGVIDLDSPAFTNNAADLDRIYSDIADSGLALAQANPKDTLTGEFAATHKTPFIQNDMWIDRNATQAAVAFELDRLKQLASNGRVAVGFFRPYPHVIAAVKLWEEKLSSADIELAPLSAAIEQK